MSTSHKPGLGRVILASGVGATIEWYDFFIYGTAAALVFNKQFFPGAGELAGTLLAFATFGVGLLARPLGALIFGHLGDTIGRKRAFVLVILIMGTSTTAVGLVPTAASIGIAAPIILVLLRILQGFAVGGEFGGASLFATENAPPGRRGFYGSLAQSGAPAGLFLSTAVFLIITNVTTPEQAASWGWRIPFLLGAPLIGLGWYIHRKMEDTLASQNVTEARETRHVGHSPIVTALRQHPLTILLAAGLCLVSTVAFYVYSTYVLYYGESVVKASQSVMLLALLCSAAAMLVASLAFAALSDRIGRRPVYLIGLIGAVAWIFPAFMLINTGSGGLIILALVVAQIFGGAMQSILPALMHELFPAHIRYSGASLGYQIGVTIGGAFTPLVATALYAQLGSYVGIALIVVAGGVLAVFCLAYIGSHIMVEPDQEQAVDSRRLDAHEELTDGPV
jgi:MHS family shikimate/dehydroshikimate transporter-like MFS transporter